MSLKFCRSRITRSDNWNFRRDGDKTSGYEVTLVNHVDIQSGKAWASKRGFGTDETCNAEIHVRATRRGEEANDTCPRKHKFEQSKPDDEVSYI